MATSAPHRPPAHAAARAVDQPDPRRWVALAFLCLSLVVIGVDNTILNVALPRLSHELGASTSQLQWIVESYVLVFAGLLLTAGSLGDRFGRRGALSAGLAVFGLGSLLSAFADSAPQLIATRAFMGIGGALIMPATLSIVTNVFTDAAERARAIGIWAGFSAMGVAIGPLAGGFLLEHFYWGSVFLVNVPIVLMALIGGRLFIPTSKDPSRPRLDPLGAVLSIIGLSTLLFALIQAPEKGWTSGVTVLSFALAAVVIAAFVLWERHTAHPMLDVSFFRNPRFSAASVAITLTFFALMGSLFVITQYRQFVLGFTPLQSGFRVLPFALVTMVVAPMTARLVRRLGTKVLVTVGLAITAVGLSLVRLAGPVDGDLVVILATVVMAVGMGLTMAPATESILGSLPREKAGIGSAVNDTTRQVGGALGIAVIGSVFSSIYASRLGEQLTGSALPADLTTEVEHGIGQALVVAERIGGPVGGSLVTAARSAFVDGLHAGATIGAVIAAIAALVAFVALPAHASGDVDQKPEEPEEEAFPREHDLEAIEESLASVGGAALAVEGART